MAQQPGRACTVCGRGGPLQPMMQFLHSYRAASSASGDVPRGGSQRGRGTEAVARIQAARGIRGVSNLPDPRVGHLPQANFPDKRNMPASVFCYKPDMWNFIENSVVVLVGHTFFHNNYSPWIHRLNAICPGPIWLPDIEEQKLYGEEKRILVCIGPREEKSLAVWVKFARDKQGYGDRFRFRVFYPASGDRSVMFLWKDHPENSYRIPRALIDPMLAGLGTEGGGGGGGAPGPSGVGGAPGPSGVGGAPGPSGVGGAPGPSGVVDVAGPTSGGGGGASSSSSGSQHPPQHQQQVYLLVLGESESRKFIRVRNPEDGLMLESGKMIIFGQGKSGNLNVEIPL